MIWKSSKGGGGRGRAARAATNKVFFFVQGGGTEWGRGGGRERAIPWPVAGDAALARAGGFYYFCKARPFGNSLRGCALQRSADFGSLAIDLFAKTFFWGGRGCLVAGLCRAGPASNGSVFLEVFSLFLLSFFSFCTVFFLFARSFFSFCTVACFSPERKRRLVAWKDSDAVGRSPEAPGTLQNREDCKTPNWGA